MTKPNLTVPEKSEMPNICNLSCSSVVSFEYLYFAAHCAHTAMALYTEFLLNEDITMMPTKNASPFVVLTKLEVAQIWQKIAPST
jgi:hypothetical protein